MLPGADPPVIVLVRPQLGENIGKAARAMLAAAGPVKVQAVGATPDGTARWAVGRLSQAHFTNAGAGPVWRTVTLFNPLVYLISAFRWAFYGVADVAVGVSLLATAGFLAVCLSIGGWMFKTGYRLKT